MVQIIDNIFSPDIIKELKKEIDNTEWKYGWRSNQSMGFGHWNHSFAISNEANGLDISDQLKGIIGEAWSYLQETQFKNHILLRCYLNSHTYGIEGYPHTDTIREGESTLVTYMNKIWKREWGGETFVYDKYKILHAELPKFNNGLLFPANMVHCARSVTRICPQLRITLMFKMGLKNHDKERDKLQLFLKNVGAFDLTHKQGRLGDHLLRVYDLLKLAGRPQHDCFVGGLHSIFGTNIYKDQCLPFEEKNKIIETFGIDVFNAVKLFSVINRPIVLEQDFQNYLPWNNAIITILPREYETLSYVECANLFDQKSLINLPRLAALWKPVEDLINN